MKIGMCTSTGITYNFYKINKDNAYILPLEIIEILYECHFDIHDLIGKGLAIDINTLKK